LGKTSPNVIAVVRGMSTLVRPELVKSILAPSPLAFTAALAAPLL